MASARLVQARCHACQLDIHEGTPFKLVREFAYHLACVGTSPARSKEEMQLCRDLAEARAANAELQTRITSNSADFHAALEKRKALESKVRLLEKNLREAAKSLEESRKVAAAAAKQLETEIAAKIVLARTLLDAQAELNALRSGTSVKTGAVTPGEENATAARGKMLELD